MYKKLDNLIIRYWMSVNTNNARCLGYFGGFGYFGYNGIAFGFRFQLGYIYNKKKIGHLSVVFPDLVDVMFLEPNFLGQYTVLHPSLT